ncbi:hypothetical protein NGA_2073500, partial [Nannochloropsis gaditana CCMP526]|uniref:uncharacterized protein n=1 Tax=Nannochloropsis gaditana (strain CCMP526) TaxID=1093141 RepID=UPI00029F5C7B
EDVPHPANPQQVDRSISAQLPGGEGDDLVHLLLVLAQAPSDRRPKEGMVVHKFGGDRPKVRINPALDDAVQALG